MALADVLAAPADPYAYGGYGGDIERKLRAKVAQQLMLEGSSAAPVQHWTQGLARVAQALSGGIMAGQIGAEEGKDFAQSTAARMALPGLTDGPDTTVPAVMAPSMPAPTMGPRPRTAAALTGIAPELSAPLSRAPTEYMKPGAIGATFQQFEPATSPGGLPAYQPTPESVRVASAGQPPQMPPLSNPTPAGAIPVQTQSITPPAPQEAPPPQVAQATTPQGLPGTPAQPLNIARGTPQFSPQESAAIKGLLSSRNPHDQAHGFALYQAAVAKANLRPEYNFHPNADGTITATNKNDPRDVRVVDPGTAQKIINFEASKAGATETAQMRAKVAVQKEGQVEGKQKSAAIVLDNVSKAINQIDEGYFTTGLTGSVMANVPGSKAHDLSNTLDTIKANIGFDKLQEMRAASPTGGALGAVSDFENRLLQATYGSVRQSQSADQLKANLTKLSQLYQTIIHEGIKPPAGWAPNKPITPDMIPTPAPAPAQAPALRQTIAPQAPRSPANFDRAAAKAAGYTDGQIDAFLRGGGSM